VNPSPSNWVFLLLVIGLALFPFTLEAAAQSDTIMPVVQAVLFYRSSCIHCVQLVTEILPPILEKYGDQLQIFYCDISKAEGDALFTSAIDQFKIETIGTPTMIVGKDVLIGSTNIEQQFPGIIDASLSQGGLGWPDITGLEQAFSLAGSMQIPIYAPPGSIYSSMPTPDNVSLTTETQNPDASPISRKLALMENNFRKDQSGNSISAIVLIGMIVSVLYGLYTFLSKPGHPQPLPPAWIIPVLCLAGCVISAYLAYVEISSAEAICGPVGHCQTVQQSEYARLFGFLPIGLLGAAGYTVIAGVWLAARLGRFRWTQAASLGILGLTTGGVLFSIYLTFLEPFVIGASCLWCLSSATLMTILMLMSIPTGKMAYNSLRHQNFHWR
jgi:uncharacterized membrane protein